MLIYIVAIIETFLYLGAVPVCAAFCLTWRGGVRLGVGVGAFERRFALKMARRKSRLLTLKPNERDKTGLRLTWQTLRRLRGAGITLRGTLCLGDAAATALACGTLNALGAALGAEAARVDIDVRPTFNAWEPEAALQGMIRARAGQIIIAAAKSGMDSIKRRFAQWKSIPSKA